MATIHLEIVTSDRTLYSGDVDMVTVPGAGGVMGILAHHAPVLSTLRPGELRIKVGNDIEEYAIGGGFIDIHDNQIIILADSAERADEIDMARAEAARDPRGRSAQESAVRQRSIGGAGDGPAPQQCAHQHQPTPAWGPVGRLAERFTLSSRIDPSREIEITR